MSWSFPNSVARRVAFTLVELLIAMTVTLLLMATLAKVFGTIGKSIQEGRAQVTMSSKLRNLSFRLRSELGGRTADARPPLSAASGQGYFQYYEGPLTESTFGNFGAEPIRIRESDQVAIGAGTGDDTDGDGVSDYFDPDIEKSGTYRRFAQFGDIDDYVAFTAEARGDDWFTGKVPRYLVDDSVDLDANGSIDSAAEQRLAMEPTVIRSKFAEIIMWASPAWETDEVTNELLLANHPSAMPMYQDRDENLIPDQVVLHQRILLIRPDLNVRRTFQPGAAGLDFEAETLRPMLGATDMLSADIVPTALSRAYPIGLDLAGTPANSGTITYRPMFPNYCHPNTVNGTPDHRFFHQSNWLVGMAPLHHFFDLSLRRIIHPGTGEALPYVACNSLADLTQPHNRFGHVRYPSRFFIPTPAFSSALGLQADAATSMPLLATGWNDRILNWQFDPAVGPADPNFRDPRWLVTESEDFAAGATPNWFSSRLTGRFNVRSSNQRLTTNNQHGLFQGWLLPQFELGNGNPTPADNTSGTGAEPDTGGWYRRYLPVYDRRWDRTGEDILATNVTAFDIRGYDPTAALFATAGPDGRAGRAGVDDDNSGTADENYVVGTEAFSELGAHGSDDEVVSVGDMGIYDLITNATFAPNDLSTSSPVPAASAPASLQGVVGRGDMVDLAYPYLGGGPLGGRTPVALSTAGQIRANYLNFLASDLSMHTHRTSFSFPNDGSRMGVRPGLGDSLKLSGKALYSATDQIVFFQPTYDTWTDYYESDGFDQAQTLDGSPVDRVPPITAASADRGTIWVLKEPSGTNGLFSNRITTTATSTAAAIQNDTGLSVHGETETSAPFPINLEAISVTIRLRDPSTEESNEFTIVESLQ